MKASCFLSGAFSQEPSLVVPEAQRWGRYEANVGPLPGVTGSFRQRQVDSASWTPLHLPITAAAGWKTNSHLADCFHHCQASRPTEPFGKVNRKLSSQIKNAQNYQPQVTTLFLQKEESMTVKKHICNQVSQKSQ